MATRFFPGDGEEGDEEGKSGSKGRFYFSFLLVFQLRLGARTQLINAVVLSAFLAKLQIKRGKVQLSLICVLDKRGGASFQQQGSPSIPTDIPEMAQAAENCMVTTAATR